MSRYRQTFETPWGTTVELGFDEQGPVRPSGDDVREVIMWARGEGGPSDDYFDDVDDVADVEDLVAKCECVTGAWAFQMPATPSADELGAARAACMADYRAFIALMEASDLETDCKVARPIYKKPLFMVGAAIVGGLVIWRVLA